MEERDGFITMTLEEQIIAAIDELWLEGDNVTLHNIWLQTTHEFHEVRIALYLMQTNKTINVDDTGNYIQRSKAYRRRISDEQ